MKREKHAQHGQVRGGETHRGRCAREARARRSRRRTCRAREGVAHRDAPRNIRSSVVSDKTHLDRTGTMVVYLVSVEHFGMVRTTENVGSASKQQSSIQQRLARGVVTLYSTFSTTPVLVCAS